MAYLVHISHLFGAGTSMLEAVARLDPARVQAFVIAREPGPLVDSGLARGLRVEVLPWLGGFRRAPWRLLFVVPRLALWLRRERVTVLELNRVKYDLLGLCWLACRLTGVKLVQRERMHAKEVPAGLRRFLLARADRLVSISRGAVEPWYQHAPDWWRRHLMERLVIIPSGRNMTALAKLPQDRSFLDALGVPADAEVVGLIAAMDPRKRPELFLRAGALIAKRRPKAWFVLVGAPYGARLAEPSPYEQSLRALARELGIAERTVFTGYRDDAYRLLQNFTLMLFPSEREALGGALVEGLAAGVPAVASAVDGIPEVVEDGITGLLVRGAVPEDYAAAALRILEDPALREKMSAASRRSAQRFDMDRLARLLEELYRSL